MSQVQVQLMTGPDLEGQVQVRKKCPGPGPDRTSDSLQLSGASRGICTLFLVAHCLPRLVNQRYRLSCCSLLP